MKYTLIETNNSLILVSDEEIKEGDLEIHKESFFDGTVKTQEQFNKAKWVVSDYKVTKLDLPYIERAAKGKNAQNGLLGVYKVLSQSPKLSKEVADEIGWINVEEVGSSYVKNLILTSTNFEEGSGQYRSKFNMNMQSYKAGFQKAQELNQKKYSEEDLRKLCELSRFTTNSIDDMINKISQPQQYSVEAQEIDGVWNVTKIIK